MPDEGTTPRTRFVAEEVPEEPASPGMDRAEMEEPVTSYGQPEIQPHHMSHSTSQFSAGQDTNNFFPNSLTEEPRKSSPGKGLVLLTVVLLAAAAGVTGFIYYRRHQTSASETAPIQPVTTSLASPSPVASPSAAMTFDRSKLKLKVQNGSGITGLAATAKTYLEGLGYKDVQIGNASSSAFEETEIAVKAEFKSIASSVVNDLKDKYTVTSKVQTLDTNEDFDVIITLGKK